jgi:uncharacterized membrane protein affecting hemolysin expression
MALMKHYRTHSQLIFCSLLLLGLGILGLSLFLESSQQDQQERVKQYGRVLANSAARQAVDATLQQDMVSLQAILKEVGQYPGVIGATIHNVENQLLVQSGFDPTRPQDGTRYNFSAPIALHNNVAGYLGVTIEVARFSSADHRALAIWLAAVFGSIFIIGWSIQRQWWSQLRYKLPTAEALVTAVVDKLPTILEAPEPEPEAPKMVAVRLSLQITNLTKLYQQLNSEGFASILRRFEAQLQGVLTLYNGQRQMLSGETLLVDFTGESFHDCSFRAACVAQLISNLAANNPSPRLHFASAVHELSAPISANKSLLQDFVIQHNNHLKPVKGEILISQRLLDTDLLEHLDIVPDSGKLISLKPPYSDLLSSQQQQLSAQ